MHIAIVNTETYPVLWTLKYTFEKFTNGFVENGFKKHIISSDEELKNTEDTEELILLFSNHGFTDKNLDFIKPLKKFKKTTKIFWHLHDFILKNGNIELENWILTGEHWRYPPNMYQHRLSFELQTKMNNYVPLTFSSFLPIKMIGKIKKNIIWDSQFVGNGYKNWWTSNIENSYIKNTPPFISEQERINSFINSMSSLGFHSDGNIANYCIVERVPEALSFGCIVFTDNKVAEEYTDGLVEYVDCLEQIKDKIKFYKNNESERYKKELMAYEWVKKYGTYTHVAENFLNKIKELKNE